MLPSFIRNAFTRGMGMTAGKIAGCFAVTLLIGATTTHAQTYDTLYKSAWAMWVTPSYNLARCQPYLKYLDSIEQELDIAIPLIPGYLGIAPGEKPQRVQIDSDQNGMGGWAAGADVGYQISDFYGAPKNSDGLRWIRGVIIGEVINASTGNVTDNWPRDWWVDDVWYFPGFMAGQILKQAADTAFSTYWLTSEHYPTYPVYNTLVSLLGQHGWPFFKNFFANIIADQMKWGNIGDNPSKIKTDYVIAYLSLSAGTNLGQTFVTDKVANADTTEVAAIMSVEERLVAGTAQKLNTTAAWNSFRSGDYASAKTDLDQLGVSAIKNPLAPDHLPANRFAPAFMPYTVTGQKLGTNASLKNDAVLLVPAKH
jgi:hypothetical protein